MEYLLSLVYWGNTNSSNDFLFKYIVHVCFSLYTNDIRTNYIYSWIIYSWTYVVGQPVCNQTDGRSCEVCECIKIENIVLSLCGHAPSKYFHSDALKFI